MKILNLYACLGGNRFLWGDEHEITAVELDNELARMYQERFPNDTVIVADAHQYLLDHYKEFDFIWSSPPCPFNSRARFWGLGNGTVNPVYPALELYQQYIFLKHHFDGRYVIENVIPYYEPLIPGQKRDRHIYWTNFRLPNVLSNRTKQFASIKDSRAKMEEYHKIDLTSYKGTQRKDKIARNLVDYEAGKTILDTAMGIIRQENPNQTQLF
jgi:DNA (cytosine-5)-methyltransferase 1